MCLAISHKDESSRLVLDKLEIVEPPFDFFAAVERFAELMNGYRTRVATGDNYLAQISPQAFALHGITYQPSELSKSQIFAQILPLFSADMIQLLDVKSLHGEFRRLERRPRSGSIGDMIEVPRHGFDDQCNAASGSLLLAANTATRTTDDYSNNITHALTEYDHLNRDAERAGIRAAPRHSAGAARVEDFSHALTDYEPFH
jgi:hypothetical protein